MPAKKSAKPKTVSKELKNVKDQNVLGTSDTKRERKTPTRFSIAVPKAATRELVIAKGRGTNLGAIPEIASELSKRKMDDPALMTLHHLAFGMAAKRIRVRTNLRQFSGVVYDAKLDRAKLESRIKARSYAALRGVCALLHLPSGGSTAEIVGRLADFLQCPVSNGKEAPKKRAKPAAAKKPADAKKPAATKKTAAPKKAAEKKPAAKKPKTEKKPAAKKAAPKKEAKKPAEKKPAEKKPAAKKTTKATTKK